ncbi:MAG: GAF domain-containing protein [Anaerolineae bacterium]|nr:GAF domain-containing protein [Anaerolineae bacterium]
MQDNRDVHKSQAELIAELAALRARLTEMEACDAERQRILSVEVEKKLRYLETLQRINATLRNTLPLQEVLETIVHGAVQALDYIGALIVLPDNAGTSLRVGASAGDQDLEAVFSATGVALEAFHLSLTIEDNPLVRAYRSGELETWLGAPERIVSGVEPEISPGLALLIQELTATKLSACIPLPTGSGTRVAKTVGVLAVFSPRDRLSEEEQAMLLGLIDQAGLAVEAARRQKDAVQLQAFNESIVQSMTEGIAVQDAQGHFIFVNPAMAALLGYTPDELIGQYWTDLVPPDQQPIIHAADERRVRGESDHYEVELLRRDGTRLPVMISGSPRFDAAGRFLGTLAVFADISERVRAEAATVRRAREMAALNETFLNINSQLPGGIESLLQLVVERAVNLLGARMGSLYLLRPAAQGRPAPVMELVVSHNLPGDYIGVTLGLGEGLAGRVTQTGQPMMVADHAQWEGRSAMFGSEPFRRVLAVPLKVQDQVMGVLEITDDEKTGLFDDDEVRLVSLFADQAAIALENARLIAESQRQTHELAGLYDTAIATTSALETDLLLARLYEQVQRLFNPDAAVVGLYDAETDNLRLTLAMENGQNISQMSGVRMSLAGSDSGLIGWVIRSGQPLLVGDIQQDTLPVRTRTRGRPMRAWLGVPLMGRDRVIGAISVQSVQPHAYDDDHRRLLESLASQVAIALDNARLYEETQQRLKELQLLFGASAAISSSLDMERVLNNSVQQLTALLGVEGCTFSKWDRDRDVLVIQLDYPTDQDPPGRIYRLDDYPASRQVLQQRQPVAVQVDDPKADASEVALMVAHGVRSLLMVPLVVRDEAVGLLELIECTRKHEFTATEISVCQTLANQIAAALENARLFEAERRQRTLAEALRRATAAVGSSLELEQVLDQILDQVSIVFGADANSIMLIEGEHTRFVRWQGYDRLSTAGRTWPISMPVADTPTFCTMRDSGKPLIVPDTAAYSGWVRFPETAWIRSHAGAPIRVRGVVVGFLLASSASPGFFDSSHAEPLQAFANSASLAIEHARLYEEAVRRNRELALLNRVAAASAASHDIEPILEVVCRELLSALGLAGAGAALIDEEKDQAVVVVECWSPDANLSIPKVGKGLPLTQGLTFPIKGHRPVEALIERQTPVLLEVEGDLGDESDHGELPPSRPSDADADLWQHLTPLHDLMRQAGVASLAILPLVVEEKTVGGLGLCVTSSQATTGSGSLSAEQVDLAWRVAGQVSGALARVRLAKSQQHLTIAVEQSADSVMITDTHGAILYVNPAFERITGYSRSEVISRNPRLLKSGKQDHAFYQHLWQTITSDLVWTGRLINRKKDGSLYTEDATISPVHNKAGEVVSYVAVKHDVSREVQLEEQFRQSQKMEAMGRLAGGIAHDFNNLLTVIQVSTWLLQRQIRPEDPRWEYVQRIQETVERATNLIKQLLSFSRRQIIEPQTLSLNRVVGDLSRMLRRIIGEDIELATSLAPDLWPVRVDPSQMEQVIMNLAINARDAMANGGTLTLETANVVLDEAYAAYHVGARPGEHVLLAISDTGVGMDDEVKAHVFEPFFTTKERGQGTGLGLSTVFGIVNQNNGYIWVYSEVGKGTTFKIYFPRAEAEPQEPVHVLPLVEEGKGTETILVVEDEAAVRELIVRVLAAHGYQVLEARDGPDALQVGEQHDGPIDLLLTDVIMPHMDGGELYERLRTPRPEMRVLYISGYTDSAIAHHGVLEPGTNLLPKPFSMEGLVHTLRSVLGGRSE